jgi:uncharacterized protein YprB with RNaseH-like and TPR domain
MKSLGLNDLERYFDIRRQSGISGGIEALAIYKRYVRTRKSDLKRQLLAYNREDIDTTLAIIDRLPDLIADSITDGVVH